MSLFPAFSGSQEKNELKNENKEEGESKTDWLQNTSFVPALPAPPVSPTPSEPLVVEVPDSSNAISSREHHHSHHKHKKSKKHKKDKRSTLELMQNDYGGKRRKVDESGKEEEIFFVDKKKEPSFYGMIKLTGPQVPRYSRGPHRRPLGKTLRGAFKDKARGRSRYYNKKQPLTCAHQTEEGEEKPFWDHDTQAELKSKTEQLNRRVSQEPTDVEAWLKLSRLQPSLLALSPRVGPALLSTLEKRAVVDKQIAILDRALATNPEAPQLITERYGLASTVVPADLLSSELRTILSLHPLLMAGWLELARVECSHLASCSVPKVTEVFAEALKAVSRRRRKEPINIVETIILGLMQACGIFLQEAGLMEQVWTLVRLYTEASLPPDSDLTFISELQTAVNQRAAAWEDQAAAEEDELLASGLPSSELWLRVERLRSSAHFLPAPDCSWARDGDPQRLVFPEDMSDLAQPVTMRSLALRVAVTSLLVLGAPPVPATHVATRLLAQGVPITGHGLLAANWPLLVADLVSPAEWLGETTLEMFKSHPLLMTGPGGLLYRQLLALVFTRMAGRLGQQEGRVLLVWWIRIETLLATIRPDKDITAQARSMAKKLLKRPEHRGHPSLFREFALLECATSRDLAGAEKILVPAIQAARAAGSIVCQPNRGGQVSVYQSLAQIWSSQGHWSRVTNLLVSLAEESCDPMSISPPAPTMIAKALAKYKNITTETLSTQNTEDEIDLLEMLTEDFLSGWVSCHAWLLCSYENVFAAGAMLENIISSLPTSTSPTLGSLQREYLFSTYVAILELKGRTQPGGATLLRKVLNRAVSEFPDNSTLVSMQANLTIPIGKDTKLFQNQQLLGNIIRVISLEHRVKLQELAQNSEIQLKCNPRILSFYEKLVSHFESRHCPLVWKLYLRYVGYRAGPDLIKSIFYKALEDCPWVKDLYVQGASLLPEELSNIQDLIVEKELRLHVAPEELEILRS